MNWLPNMSKLSYGFGVYCEKLSLKWSTFNSLPNMEREKAISHTWPVTLQVVIDFSVNLADKSLLFFLLFAPCLAQEIHMKAIWHNKCSMGWL
jgi:hypothetical protein